MGVANNDAEGKQPAPPAGGEQTENTVGRCGCCCDGREGNEKKQSLLFERKFLS